MTSTPPSKLISDAYRKTLETKIAREPRWGATGHRHADSVAQALTRLDAKSYLDYGSGMGTLTTALAANGALKGRATYEYDPGRGTKLHPEFTKADLVTCIDVMEHVEEDRVTAVLDDIASKTSKEALFWIATGPAIHKLPDGRNAHITIHDIPWWMMRLGEHFLNVHSERANNKGFWVRCTHAR